MNTPKKPFSIRPAREGDEEAIHRLLGLENPDLEENSPYHPSRVTSIIMDTVREPQGKERCWIAEADGKPVGFIRTEKLGEGVFVEEDYRGNKIGPALVKTREDYLIEQGQKSFLMRVFADNTNAIKRYKELGYEFDKASSEASEKYKTEPRKENETAPILTMIKNLG